MNTNRLEKTARKNTAGRNNDGIIRYFLNTVSDCDLDGAFVYRLDVGAKQNPEAPRGRHFRQPVSPRATKREYCLTYANESWVLDARVIAYGSQKKVAAFNNEERTFGAGVIFSF